MSRARSKKSELTFPKVNFVEAIHRPGHYLGQYHPDTNVIDLSLSELDGECQEVRFFVVCHELGHWWCSLTESEDVGDEEGYADRVADGLMKGATFYTNADTHATRRFAKKVLADLNAALAKRRS